MGLVHKIWATICKWAIWAVMASGLYWLHISIMSLLWDRQYRDVPVKDYPTIDALAKTVAAVAESFYRPDGWERLWDSISPPGRFQTFLDNGTVGDATANDCDDFANYIAHALNVSHFPNIRNIRLMYLAWMQKNSVPAAHMVCLFETLDGRYGYMDYGQPTYHATVEAVAEYIVRGFDGEQLLVWAEVDMDTYRVTAVNRS